MNRYLDMMSGTWRSMWPLNHGRERPVRLSRIAQCCVWDVLQRDYFDRNIGQHRRRSFKIHITCGKITTIQRHSSSIKCTYAHIICASINVVDSSITTKNTRRRSSLNTSRHRGNSSEMSIGQSGRRVSLVTSQGKGGREGGRKR